MGKIPDHLISPHLTLAINKTRKNRYLLLDTLAFELLEVLLAGFHGLGVELVFTHGPPEEAQGRGETTVSTKKWGGGVCTQARPV